MKLINKKKEYILTNTIYSLFRFGFIFNIFPTPTVWIPTFNTNPIIDAKIIAEIYYIFISKVIHFYK